MAGEEVVRHLDPSEVNAGYVRTDPGQRIVEIDTQVIERLLAQNEQDAMAGVRTTLDTWHGGSRMQEDSLIGLSREFLQRDPITDFFQIEFPHGLVLEQSRRKHYYRGERKLYPTTVPTLERKLSRYETETEKELYRLVSDMRIYEFKALIDNFEAVEQWDASDVLYEPLAQHYGLETSWLDITNDFATALFFATCTQEGGKWRALCAEDLKKDEGCRYGVIFHRTGKNVALSELGLRGYCYSPHKPRPLITEVGKNYPMPFGVQPFMRSSVQMGYGIYARGMGSLQDDSRYEQLRFKQDPGLSREVFEMMDKGKRIYPDESLVKVSHHIGTIASAACFSEEAFMYALKRNHLFTLRNPDACVSALRSFRLEAGEEVAIGKRPWSLGKARIQDVNLKSRQAREDFKAHAQITTRRSSTPGMGIWSPWMLPEHPGMPGVEDMDYRVVDGSHSVFSDRWIMRFYTMFLEGKVPDF